MKILFDEEAVYDVRDDKPEIREMIEELSAVAMRYAMEGRLSPVDILLAFNQTTGAILCLMGNKHGKEKPNNPSPKN